jgi:hypothetical protein
MEKDLPFMREPAPVTIATSPEKSKAGEGTIFSYIDQMGLDTREEKT